jgi:hypothetical protein
MLLQGVNAREVLCNFLLFLFLLSLVSVSYVAKSEPKFGSNLLTNCSSDSMSIIYVVELCYAADASARLWLVKEVGGILD